MLFSRGFQDGRQPISLKSRRLKLHKLDIDKGLFQATEQFARDPDLGFVRLEQHAFHKADCGHFVYDPIELFGDCERCGSLNCPRCMARCQSCFAVFCASCLRRLGEKLLCPNCRIKEIGKDLSVGLIRRLHVALSREF